ncbi:2-keto-4-pentenoate hydratase [Nocardioides currus]|uniref:4-oxalocrotonate decarboxylase n=1 Tax=Nocardioides currus TaxID=2133958 RepID=A0A2R7YY92_9ACTN|nr:fumarylacetoacetate hydrolase family protein [Nocardioides currus]PUA81323.1 4-oxalocrotonate decarboxylase [Nocardioides currus]
MSLDPHEAAALLAAARRERRTLPRFSDEHDGVDEAWGYDVQDLDRAARVAAGEWVVGAKLGLTSEAKQRTMHVHQPIVGFLTDAMAAPDLGGLVQPRVEPEVAFRLGADLDRALGRGEIASVLDGVAVALEVIDSRWTGYHFRLGDVLADNTSAAGFVVGEWRGVDLEGLANLAATFAVDGEVVSTTSPAAILGDPSEALVHLSRHLEARGETLPAGSVVLAGAMADAVPLTEGRRFEAVVEGLGSAVLSTL